MKNQNIVITGVSRPSSVGATLVKRMVAAGANVYVHGHMEYDLKMNYKDANEDFIGKNIHYMSSNFLNDGQPEKLIKNAHESLGDLTGLVLCHAYSTNKSMGNWTKEHINNHLIVNVTASMLMMQEFQKYSNGGAITLFTSGQYLGPMSNEIAYAVSKDAIIGLCKQTAPILAEKGIRVNCINPGPVDTGYLDGDDYENVANMFPEKRWGTPNDTADLVEFLHSDKGKWITGQIIASEGGFNRY